MHCLPKFSEASAIKLGFFMAEEFMETLSAPASNSFLTSSTELTPPPTVKGIKQFLAVLLMISNNISLFSKLAVISRKQSSSAPCSS